MLVAVPLAFQQQGTIVHLDRQMPISPQSVVCVCGSFPQWQLESEFDESGCKVCS